MNQSLIVIVRVVTNILDNNKEYLLDTGWGCGLIIVDDFGFIIDSAPIFKSLIDKKLNKIEKWHSNKIGLKYQIKGLKK